MVVWSHQDSVFTVFFLFAVYAVRDGFHHVYRILHFE